MKDSSVEGSKKSIYQQTELFAPNVAILSCDSIEEATAQANITQYGLVASVFTKSHDTYEKCWDGLQRG